MKDERFNELLNGPLNHPFAMFRITRLVLALRDVIEATGAAGEAAFEQHCQAREIRDREIAGESRRNGRDN